MTPLSHQLELDFERVEHAQPCQQISSGRNSDDAMSGKAVLRRRRCGRPLREVMAFADWLGSRRAQSWRQPFMVNRMRFSHNCDSDIDRTRREQTTAPTPDHHLRSDHHDKVLARGGAPCSAELAPVKPGSGSARGCPRPVAFCRFIPRMPRVRIDALYLPFAKPSGPGPSWVENGHSGCGKIKILIQINETSFR